jgi:hypothetical protein
MSDSGGSFGFSSRESDDSAGPDPPTSPDQSAVESEASSSFRVFAEELTRLIDDDTFRDMVAAFQVGPDPESRGFTSEDVLSVLGAGRNDLGGLRPPFKHIVHPMTFIQPGQSSIRLRSVPEGYQPTTYIPGGKKLVGNGKKIFVATADGSARQLVGESRVEVNFECIIPEEDFRWVLAELTESCFATATGLGYSNYLHALASVVIAKTIEKSIYEPHQRGDVWTPIGVFEVGGFNYDKKPATHDYVVGKYELVCAVLEPDELLSDMVRLAQVEDSQLTSGFDNTGLDQGASPYTPVLREMAELTRLVTDKQKEGIVDQLKAHISRRPPVPKPEEDRSRATDDVTAFMRSGMKTRIDPATGERISYMPTPLRVLAPSTDVPDGFIKSTGESDRSLYIRPYLQATSIGTTYHTLTEEEYSLDYLAAEVDFGISDPMYGDGSAMACVYRLLATRKAFQSAQIENELLSKINGGEGSFYSVHSRVGVAWQRVKSGSLTYYACYFTATIPGDRREIGQWEEYTDLVSGLTVWRGPTFKVSSRDISHSSVVDLRFFCAVVGIMGFVSEKVLNAYIARMIPLLPMYLGSSWKTSVLAGESRYYTLCTIAGTGNIKGIVQKALKENYGLPLTSSDFVYLHLLRESERTRSTDGQDQTPLLRLPPALACIEKDLPQGFQWHIRGDAHETRCMRKLYKAMEVEVANRDKILAFFEAQLQFLKDMIEHGVAQYRFDELMDWELDVPVYNHIFMMAMSKLSTPQLKERIGARQESTGATMSSIITDHHCYDTERPGDHGEGTVFCASYVVDAVVAEIERLGKPRTLLEAVSIISRTRKVVNYYLMHPKDQKSADREIAQMLGIMRFPQALMENLIRVYCDAEESDFMTDPGKADAFVTQSATIMRDGGVVRSEDKSFFCGHLLPEALSLSTLNVAIDVGSTALVCASAIQRCNTRRYSVLPAKADRTEVPKCAKQHTVYRKERGCTSETVAVEQYFHMMQGIMALGAALNCTVYVKGYCALLASMIEDVDKYLAMTTSDDTVRGVTVATNPKYEVESIEHEFINRPLEDIRHASMRDNEDKPIIGRRLAEFNNMAVGPNGMVAQQMSHCQANLQPLLSKSLAGDCIQVVSNARGSLFWGDSIDIAVAMLKSGLCQLRQKWLLSHMEVDCLRIAGFLPNTNEELVGGFSIRSDRTLANIWYAMDDEQRDDVLSGNVSLTRLVSKYSLARGKRRKKHHRISIEGVPYMVARAVKQVDISRKYKQRLSGNYVRVANPADRAAAKQALMDFVTRPTQLPDEEVMVQLRASTAAPIIHIVPRPFSGKHRMPQTIGNRGHTGDRVEIRKVLAKRLVGIDYGRRLRPEESTLAELDEETFKHEHMKLERAAEYDGMSYRSPTGLPMMKFTETGMLTRPMMFDYTVDLVEKHVRENTITIDGVAVPSVSPVLYGGRVLAEAKRQGAIPAFGRAPVGTMIRFFFKPVSGRVASVDVLPSPLAYLIPRQGGRKIMCPLLEDFSCINPRDFCTELLMDDIRTSGLAGDPIAILNYGRYLQSAAPGGQRLMSSIFRSLGGERPHYIAPVLPGYPSFHPQCSVLSPGRLTVFEGYSSVRLLKLARASETDDTEMVEYVDLRGPRPLRTQQSVVDVGWG